MPARKSKQHKAVCSTLRKLFSRVTIREEHPIKHNGKTYLVDIYVPKLCAAFEVQGEQHQKYNAWMHKGSKCNFVSQVKRDVEKAEACIAEDIKLIYIYPKDKVTPDFLMELILGEDDERIATRQPEETDSTDSSGA